MHTKTRCAAAMLWLCLGAPALAQDAGPYVQLTGGRTTYDHDCGFYSCSGSRGKAVKLGAGYRFGVFALEAWGTDWGRSPVYDFYGSDYVRLRSVGLSAAWLSNFGATGGGVLRAGFANVQQTRSVETFRRFEGTFGLGISFRLMPHLAFEIDWDFTTSTGGSDRIGSVFAQAVTAGLRVQF